MKNQISPWILAAIPMTLGLGSIQAAVLAQYTFAGDNGVVNPGPSTEDPLVTASTFTASAGVSNPQTAGGTVNSNNNGATAAQPWYQAAGFGTSVDTDLYLQFVLTADPGFQLDLENIVVDSANGGSGDRGFTLAYSFDDFVTTAGSFGPNTNIDGTGNFNRYTFNLLDEDQLANLTDSSVTFRFYGFAPTTGGTVRFDNVTVNGEVVPEPSTSMLGALFALAALSRRRRA